MLGPLASIAILLPAWGLTQLPNAAAGGNIATQHLSTAAIRRRVVKSFNFDERKLGNFEAVPMNWLPIEGPAYPRFLEARFDEAVGHLAAPSFHLALEGGSLASHYLAKDIPVHPGSEYRVTAWIRPQKLTHARAFVTAYYLDHALRKIGRSERRSAEVRGPGTDEPWQRVTIDLPPGDEQARWIGLACHVEQPLGGDGLVRRINHHDVHGAAWLDDITVLRLPQFRLSLNSSSGIFLSGQPTVCTIRMHDLDGRDIQTDLDILDAEGNTVETHHLDGAALIRHPMSLQLGDLPAGWFAARLQVGVGGQTVSRQERRFVRLNPDLDPIMSGPGGFGVAVDAAFLSQRRLGEDLLKILSPSMVKIPLWRRDLTDEEVVRGAPDVERLVESLHASGMTVVGVIEAVPAGLARQYDPARRSVSSVLAADPNRWRPYLALVLARYGQRIRAWQLGADGKPHTGKTLGLAKALTNLREEMRTLIGLPALVIPWSVVYPTEQDGLSADVLSLTIPSHLAAQRIAEQIEGLGGDALAARWAMLQQPRPELFDRRWRLIHYARRLVAARGMGLDAVFVPQPWQFRTVRGPAGRTGWKPVPQLSKAVPISSKLLLQHSKAMPPSQVIVDPQEEFIILRTVNQALGGMDPLGSVWVGPHVQARLFSDMSQKRGTLVVWGDAQGLGESALSIDLGQDSREVDLWGNVRTPEKMDGGREFMVDAMPRIIRPVSPERVRMLASFTVEPPELQATVRDHRRELTFTNTYASRLSGVLRLQPPAGWRIRPKMVRFDLAAGQSTRVSVSLRIPSNQAAGDYELIGHLTVDAENAAGLTMRALLRVDAPGLDVDVMTYRQGEAMNIVQRITNHTDRPLDLRAFVIAPHQPRTSRLIRNLAVGQTAIRKYEISQAGTKPGDHIRVSVEQVGGPLRHNTAIKLN